MPRILRAVVAAAGCGVLLGSCAWASPIQTQQLYAPSDGARFDLAADVRVENMFVLSEGAGEPAQLMGVVVNDTSRPVTVTIDIEGSSEDVRVPARELANLRDQAPLPSFEPLPGQAVEVSLTWSGTVKGTIPVLDGTIPPYDEYMP